MALITITDRSTQADLIRKAESGGLGNTLLAQYERGGYVKAYRFTYINDTGGTLANGSYIELCNLPAGLVLPTSVVSTSAFGASRVLNLGFQEFTNTDGTVVAADPNAFLADYDISIATYCKVWGTDTASETAGDGFLLTGSTKLLAQVTGGTIPANGTIEGIVFVIST